MFYVRKTSMSSGGHGGINDENVFCHCPRCGAEVPVDLNEFFGDAEFDLFGTAICCTECSRKMRCEK